MVCESGSPLNLIHVFQLILNPFQFTVKPEDMRASTFDYNNLSNDQQTTINFVTQQNRHSITIY